ncbi:MAG: endonuclease [Lachnospiraceae bacterium]|nr:endonuclease [Lachnospiraceae bacterium]
MKKGSAKNIRKKILTAVLVLIGALVLLVGGYVLYMQCQYYRIADFEEQEIENNASDLVEIGQEYTLMTYNVGFGAYSADYSFFMDTGEMSDGTPTTGQYARARSKEEVWENIDGSIAWMKQADCDFYFIQEVDEKATRSYRVNERERICEAFSGYASVFVNNFHSAYLFYPFYEPHGAVEAGMLNLSRYRIRESIRRQFPVSDAFITKFTDLDRCFSVNRYEIDGGKELVLIQLHMSAYDEGGTVRAEQLKLLNAVLEEEGGKGNYVIAGGDFNHALEGAIEAFPSEQKIPGWVFALDSGDLAEGFHFVEAENAGETATCRGADIPYEKGVNYVTIVDGFIVSDNVKASAVNVETEFRYSDHNPVILTFSLK